MDAIRKIGLYTFASRIGTDPVLTALKFHRCLEVGWEKTAVKDRFGSYELFIADSYGLSKAVMLEKNTVSGAHSAPTMATLTAVLVSFRAGVSAVHLVSIRQDYNMHRRQSSDRGEGRRSRANEGVDLELLFENDFLCAEAGDAECVTEDVVLVRRAYWFKPYFTRRQCTKTGRGASVVRRWRNSTKVRRMRSYPTAVG